jgi:hypothetical protein
MLAFMIPIDAMDWQAEYDQLRREIEQYSPELAKKPHCVVFTKLDLLGEHYIPEIEAPAAFAKSPSRRRAGWGSTSSRRGGGAACSRCGRPADDATGRGRRADDARPPTPSCLPGRSFAPGRGFMVPR